MFETKLLQAFAQMNIPCDEQKAAQMHRYFSLLLQANAQMNLTNVTDEDDAILLHFCDSASLLPLFSFPEQSCCLDVGTGAGFPGMVLAILCPDVEFTLCSRWSLPWALPMCNACMPEQSRPPMSLRIAKNISLWWRARWRICAF